MRQGGEGAGAAGADGRDRRGRRVRQRCGQAVAERAAGTGYRGRMTGRASTDSGECGLRRKRRECSGRAVVTNTVIV